MKLRIIFYCIHLTLAAGHLAASEPDPAGDLLARRNPYLAELRTKDESVFRQAVFLISKHRRESGLSDSEPPPPTQPTGRDMTGGLGRELTLGNPDLLWLYNSSPEGMNDLISLMKSAGQKPK